MVYSHHSKGIEIITDILKQEKSVLAVIVGGSIAHKTESDGSDIDIMIVIPENDYAQAIEENKMWYFNKVAPEGREIYIDGKFISLPFIKDVAERGSEPARFAFSGAFATYSKIDGLQELIHKAAEYPKCKKQDNLDRFMAQLKAWEWYVKEAVKKQNGYLLRISADKAVLFAGRLILAHNEMLFPYHKWFMSELQRAADKPRNFVGMLKAIIEKPDAEMIYELVRSTQDFIAKYYKVYEDWTNMFIRDSELGWKTGNLPVDDI